MKPSWFIAMGVCVLSGCGTGASVPEPSAPSSTKSVNAERVATSEKTEPSASLPSPGASDAGRAARRNELSAPGLDDRFAVTRQVTALERSIELYHMFIERAGDDPEYEEAVRRSRARIDDARITICFLREKVCEP